MNKTKSIATAVLITIAMIGTVGIAGVASADAEANSNSVANAYNGGIAYANSDAVSYGGVAGANSYSTSYGNYAILNGNAYGTGIGYSIAQPGACTYNMCASLVYYWHNP